MALVAVVLAAGALSACGSDKQPNHPNQATVTINGNKVADNQRVTCNQQQWYWTINIGDENVAGAKAMLNHTGDKLIADSVHIRNLGGFTGMYSTGDGGDASANFSADTFTISGTAQGSSTYQPGEPAKATFKIVATC